MPKTNDVTQEPFRRYHLEKKQDCFPVYLNTEERALLNRFKRLVEQPKDSTALKQLAWMGAFLIESQPTRYVVETLFKNKKKNERLGIPIVE
jgi:hypothetical protein